MRFPTYRTRDLNGDRLTIPDDLAGEVTLCVAAYERWQQAEVDTWIRWAVPREDVIPEFRFYELPVVGRMSRLGRASLDFWMRRGIPGRRARGRTITLYEDAAAFRAALGITTADTVALVLLDPSRAVCWTGLGPHAPQTAAALEAAARGAGVDLRMP